MLRSWEVKSRERGGEGDCDRGGEANARWSWTCDNADVYGGDVDARWRRMRGGNGADVRWEEGLCSCSGLLASYAFVLIRARSDPTHASSFELNPARPYALVLIRARSDPNHRRLSSITPEWPAIVRSAQTRSR